METYESGLINPAQRKALMDAIEKGSSDPSFLSSIAGVAIESDRKQQSRFGVSCACNVLHVPMLDSAYSLSWKAASERNSDTDEKIKTV